VIYWTLNVPWRGFWTPFCALGDSIAPMTRLLRIHRFLRGKNLYYFVPVIALFLWCAWKFNLYSLGLPLTDDQGHLLRGGR
jgi:hypothetical protein